MVKVIAGLLPVSPWKFQRARGVFATTMRDQDGQSPARTKKVPNSNQPHQFYGGVDLHARSMFVKVLDSKGNTRFDQDRSVGTERFQRHRASV